MSKFCTECGSEINEGSQFCTQCGAKAPADQPVTQPMPEQQQKPVDNGETRILTPDEMNPQPQQDAQPQYQPQQSYQAQNQQQYQPQQSYQTANQQSYQAQQQYAQPQQNYGQSYAGGAPQYNGAQYNYQQYPQTPVEENETKVGLGYFFGMQLVYSIPIVRLIVEIVMMCSEKNPTKKNFAKANFIWLCIGYGILILASIALASLGLSLASALGNAFGGGSGYYYY